MTLFDPNAFDVSQSITLLKQSGIEDPKLLHDQVSKTVDAFARNGRAIPVELRHMLEELEAEIAETYFNNVPV